MQHDALRALSILQPWAELILRGDKTVEFRSQITKIRGSVYIYAALGKPDGDTVGIASDELPKGVLVGTVEIVGCDPVDDGYEWQLASPTRLVTPIKPENQPQPVWFNPFDQVNADTDTILADEEESTSRVSDPMLQIGGTLMGEGCTAYHAKLFAHELLRRSSSDSVERFYTVQSTDDRTPQDFVPFDSEVERDVAEKLDSSEAVRFFCKLPGWFKIPTPLGDYNPDWAVVLERDEKL